MKTVTPVLFALWAALASPILTGCSESDETSVDEGCTRDEDCPLPDRQKCKVDLGICVGHTTTPGDIDGGTVSDAETD